MVSPVGAALNEWLLNRWRAPVDSKQAPNVEFSNASVFFLTLSAERLRRPFFASSVDRQIAAELCVYTNSNFTVHSLDVEDEESEA